MQPMWICNFLGKQFEDPFENAQWRKTKQMQPMWLRLFTGRQFENTFENAQRRKMQPMWICLFSGNLRAHLKRHSGEKPNKCNQCDYASSHASHLKTHLTGAPIQDFEFGNWLEISLQRQNLGLLDKIGTFLGPFWDLTRTFCCYFHENYRKTYIRLKRL